MSQYSSTHISTYPTDRFIVMGKFLAVVCPDLICDCAKKCVSGFYRRKWK